MPAIVPHHGFVSDPSKEGSAEALGAREFGQVRDRRRSGAAQAAAGRGLVHPAHVLELLFARGEDEVLATVPTDQSLILHELKYRQVARAS